MKTIVWKRCYRKNKFKTGQNSAPRWTCKLQDRAEYG